MSCKRDGMCINQHCKYGQCKKNGDAVNEDFTSRIRPLLREVLEEVEELEHCEEKEEKEDE